MERPDYFVIRIYRRDTSDPSRMEGIVEVVGSDQAIPFATPMELWALLQRGEPLPAPRSAPKR